MICLDRRGLVSQPLVLSMNNLLHKFPTRAPALAIFLLTLSSFVSLAKDSQQKTEANVLVEISFTAAKPHDDPFNTVEVNVLFTDASGSQKLVPAFWAGGSVWKVRYASSSLGVHRWQSQCSDS